MPTLDDIRRPVKQDMKQFQQRLKEAVKNDIWLLNVMISYVLRNSGKQMRPLFVFLTAKMVGKVTDSSYTAATLIELMHTATLIHDDVIDESNERRGVFSVNAIWRPKLAVLLGDYFLARGLLLATTKRDHDLLDIVSGTVKEMSEGELLQLRKSRKPSVDLDSYYEVIHKKTATLIASCIAAGAKSAGAEEEEIQRLREMGTNIGMAFQIKDDLFDYQPKGIIGKPTGNDLKDQKFTLPLIYALENCQKSERKKILKLFRSGTVDNAKIRTIVDFVKENGGMVFATEKMLEYKKKAEDVLQSYPDSEARNALQALIDFTVERNK